MRHRILALTTGALLVGIVAIGCGGGESTIAKRDFVSQVNAACEEEQKELRDDPAPGIKEAILRSAAALQAEAEEMEAIGAPNGDQAKIDALLKQMRKAVALVRANRQRDVEQANIALERAEKLADDYGLEKCLLS